MPKDQSPKLLALLALLARAAAINSVESSNRIERVTAPRARLEALVWRVIVPATQPEREIVGYAAALELIHESAGEIDFSVEVILQLHAMLSPTSTRAGGRWKTTDNQIVERNKDGSHRRVRFRPVGAAATPQAMSDLVSLYAAAIELGHEPLVVIALTILDFLCIHPFADGNGRLSRLLTLLLLRRAGYTLGRYISLEREIERSMETYYESLEASSQGWHSGAHNVHPWLNYFWGVLVAASKDLDQAVSGLTAAVGPKTAFVEAAVRRRWWGRFSISAIEADCPDVSREMVRLVLRQMKARGEIALRGKGRGASWALVDTKLGEANLRLNELVCSSQSDR